MKKIISTTLLILSLSFNTYALSLKDFSHAHLQVGTWQENYQQVQATNSGDTNGLGLDPYISLALSYPLSTINGVSPELGWVLPRRSDKITKNIFFLRSDYYYLPYRFLKLRLGLSLMINSSSSDGGEESLPNGDSTEVYFLPEERRNSYNQTIDLGVEYIKDQFSLKLQSYIFRWRNEQKRMISHTLSFNYYFPLEDLK
ncbi:MAG: hypothetical protein OEW87_08115 [Flavobacteriaceae bacterium]|nr:hypothetical protein [Flavobacteriaceae bacterium]